MHLLLQLWALSTVVLLTLFVLVACAQRTSHEVRVLWRHLRQLRLPAAPGMARTSRA